MRKLLLSIFVTTVLLLSAHATTIKVPNPGNWHDIRPAIANAVNNAADGDIIELPAGTFKFTGTATITKFISFKGEGIKQTILYRDSAVLDDALTSKSMLLFNINNDASSKIKISGITFRSKPPEIFTADGGSRAEDLGIQFEYAVDFRVTGCRFEYFGDAAIQVRHKDNIARGLIDHNEFYHNQKGQDGLGLGYGVAIYGANQTWIRTVNFGSDNFIFIENNSFDFHRHSIAAGGAALYVVRYNTITNNIIKNTPYIHAIDGHAARGVTIGTENYFSVRAAEIYNNSIINTTFYYGDPIEDGHQIKDVVEIAILLCGGDALIHDNIIKGYRFGTGVYVNILPWGSNYPIPYSTGYLSGLSQGLNHSGTDEVNANGDGFYWNNDFTAYKDSAYWENNSLPFYNYQNNFFKEGRDYHLEAKPNYKPFTYPHPLISPEVVVSTSAVSTCLGKSIALTAGDDNLTYSWEPASSLSSTVGTTVIANPKTTTSYTVTGTSAGTIVSKKIISVTVNTAPIAGGASHTALINCSFCANGGVSLTGLNSSGQLANNTINDALAPVFLNGFSGINAVATGGRHTLFLRSDGTVWASGLNYNGQLGDGTTNNRDVPVQVRGLTDITAIAAGAFHSLFLKKDGTVWACGSNSNGQLGDNSTTDKNIPVQVNNISGIIALTAGRAHSVFVKADGKVWACGSNDYGQIGDGSTVQRNTAVIINSLSNITAAAAGYYHSLFLTGEGTVKATGLNVHGQLGDATTIQRTSPVTVNNLTAITNIAAGGNHSVFLKSDNTVWTCGLNTYGQLGDGTYIQRSTPVLVNSLNGVKIIGIAAGSNHALFLDNDGVAWASGRNANGQLGNKSTANSNKAIKVIVDNCGDAKSLDLENMARTANGEAEATTVNNNNDLPLKSIIYPNPADGELNIQLLNLTSEKTVITVFDAFGRHMAEYQASAGETNKNISTKELASGVYFLILQNNQQTFKQKVVIVH